MSRIPPLVSLLVIFFSTSDWGERPRTMFNWRISSWEFERFLSFSTFLIWDFACFSFPSSKNSSSVNKFVLYVPELSVYDSERSIYRCCFKCWPRICCAFFKNGAVCARPMVTAFRFSGIFNVNFSSTVSSLSFTCSTGNNAGNPAKPLFL